MAATARPAARSDELRVVDFIGLKDGDKFGLLLNLYRPPCEERLKKFSACYLRWGPENLWQGRIAGLLHEPARLATFRGLGLEDEYADFHLNYRGHLLTGLSLAEILRRRILERGLTKKAFLGANEKGRYLTEYDGLGMYELKDIEWHRSERAYAEKRRQKRIIY